MLVENLFRQLPSETTIGDELGLINVRSADSEATSPDPQAVSSDPQAVSSDPQAVSSDPQAVSPDPQAVSPDPQAASPSHVVTPISQGSSPLSQVSSPASQKIALELSNIKLSSEGSLTIDHLASAIGCVAVLRDLDDIVMNLRSSLDRYDSRIETDLRWFNRGQKTESLGSLQKDYSALRISRRYRDLSAEISPLMEAKKRLNRNASRQDKDEQISEQRGTKRKRRWPQHKQPKQPRHQGLRLSTHVYDRMINDWKDPVKDGDKERLRRNLIEAHRRGQVLLQYEDFCTPAYPLWMLLPGSIMSCPLDPSYEIRPRM